MHRPAKAELDLAGGELATMSRASGSDLASRSSLVTTRVSPDGGEGLVQTGALAVSSGEAVESMRRSGHAAGIGGMTGYVVVFLVGVAVWCVIGWFLASRPLVAKALSRWGHLILPFVLIAIGLVILGEEFIGRTDEMLLPHKSTDVPYQYVDADGRVLNLFDLYNDKARSVVVDYVTITFSMSGVRWRRTGNRPPVRVVK